jgi:hypothetical protein
VDVTEVLRPGGNTVQLELATGLRNLLGPHHRRQGERCEAWGEQAWSGRWDKESGTGYEQWYLPENRTEDTRAWTDDYFFVEFGLTEAPRLDLVEERNAD